MTPVLAFDLGGRADIASPKGVSWFGEEKYANGTEEDQLTLGESHVG